MSEPNTIMTGALCKVCKGGVVAEVGWTNVGVLRGNYPTVFSFHCANPDCGIQYHHPPGKPDMRSQIIAKMREERKSAYV